jgi:hypothetical protein
LLPGVVSPINKVDAIATMPGAHDGQPDVKKVLTATPNVRVIRLCPMCKYVAVVTSTGVGKEAFVRTVVEEATSSDECSCQCHALYARMKACRDAPR